MAALFFIFRDGFRGNKRVSLENEYEKLGGDRAVLDGLTFDEVKQKVEKLRYRRRNEAELGLKRRAVED
jgi:hypothetical protein